MEQNILINHTVVHTLNYLVIELMRRAYQLAMTDELNYLSGLVDTRLDKWMRGDDENGDLIVLDDDFELLSTIEDPNVKIVVESMIRILETNRTFQIIQNIDLDEALMDIDASGEAAGILNTYILEYDKSEAYKNVLSELETCYTSVSIILYHCMTALELGSTEVWEEAMDIWTAPSGNHGFEYEPSGNAGVLLLQLNGDLMKDALRLNNFR